MKITPSPRILKMLGQIEFSEWQCLAELIDNSFDAINQTLSEDAHGLTDGDMCVEVILPTSESDREASVEVRDRGPGMDKEKLAHAVRAGWSGNDQFDQLGLFGMGFNVATARLGRITTVLTSRQGDKEWIGVEIDLDNIGDDFEATDLREPKSDPSDHGTRVRISKLDRDRSRILVRRSAPIREKLGHIYSWILSNTPISIRVNGRVVPAKLPCAWGDERSVTRGSGRNAEHIPARIKINEILGEADACMDCGNWQSIGMDICEACGSRNLKTRERRIHGWVGIQRYLHRSHYGIDFLRNGRKIVVHSKDVFAWLDPNNPTAESEIEYPVEVPADQGRIVGEIHLDHVPVHYMKDRFDSADRSWKSAMEFIRGRGPLKPQRARQLNYEQNDSPIGKLFRGYRRNDPGYDYLVPGDGRRAIHQQATEWALKFHRGDREFQDDNKWWEAVVYHEEEKARANAPQELTNADVDEDAVMQALGLGGEDSSTDVESPQPTQVEGEDPPLTLYDKTNRLLEEARPIPSLSKEVFSRKLGESLVVSAYEVGSSPLHDGNNDAQSPAWLVPTDGGGANLFIDPRHEVFMDYGASALEVAVAQIAHFMLIRSNLSDHSISQIIDEILRVNFHDEKTNFSSIQIDARSTLEHVIDALPDLIDEDVQRAWSLLSSDEIAEMERSAALHGRGITVNSEPEPSFIKDAPPYFLLKLFDSWPEVFLDGKIFVTPYSAITDESSKHLSKARVYSLLMDVVSVASEQRAPSSANQLKRMMLSVELLSNEMVTS